MSKVFTPFFYIFLIVFTVFICLLVYFFNLFVDDKRFFYKIGRFWGKIVMLSTFPKIEVINKCPSEKMNKNYIIMANHQSAFDIFLIYGYLPFYFNFLSKKEVFEIPIFGRAMKILGTASVDRGNRQGLKDTIREMEECLARGASILIFPEGTRSEDGKILPFKKGGFLLAKKVKTEILPVVIVGTKDIMPKKSFWVTPFRKVKFYILEPISETENYDDLMERVRNLMIKYVEQ